MILANFSLGSVDFPAAITAMWKLLGIIWLVGAFFRRPAIGRPRQSSGSWVFQIALAALAFVLLLSNRLDFGWLTWRFVPDSLWIQLTGFTLALTGCLIAIWARVTLGGNWSALVTLQQDHALVTEGPYALARHPIYLGFLLGFTGTVLVVGELRALLGLALITIRLVLKLNLEEKLMLQAFPSAYPAYRSRVKALIPGIL